jgi:Reverse transcriptase (RNA-dependent DNA polymerase)
LALESYLSCTTQSVRLGDYSFSPVSLSSGVPQGSVLGPLLFSIYTSPTVHICSTYPVNQRQYADDTQLFIALSPSNFTSLISNLENCLSSLPSWFHPYSLALNHEKSDNILFGIHQRAHCYTDFTTVNVAGAVIPLADRVKILGITLDTKLTMDDHVAAVCKAALYHIRALQHIRPAITDDVAKTAACSIVGARLDYANSVLYGVSQKNILRHQRIQNILARVVAGPSTTSADSSSSYLLYHLHWLPIDSRIKFRLAKLAFISCSSSSPHFLA